MNEKFFVEKSEEILPEENTIENPKKGEDFFIEHTVAIEDYAEQVGLVFKKGTGWEMNMEKGEVTYDPNFFSEKGYSPAESMWATCHEIEHFRDWRKDPETYSKLFSRFRGRKRLHILYNCIDDIMVNREVDNRFPSHSDTKDNLYRQKLFPKIDYLDAPKHLQFAYSLLREKILPEDILIVDQRVREEIKKLLNIDGNGTDLIDLVSDPEAKSKDRFNAIKDYIEPIFERFFQEDLEKRKKEEDEKGGDPGTQGKEPKEDPQGPGGGPVKKGEGKPKKGEDYFSKEYEDFESKSPKPFSIDNVKKALDKEIEEKKRTPEKIAEEQFEREHEVSVKDVGKYREEFKKIESHIESLRNIFEKIISKRKEIKRRLKERTDQGVIIDPSLIAQAYIDAKSGISDSVTQLKVKKIEHDENKPNNFEFTLVCDLSMSMNQEDEGGKSYEQRLCAILIMEALAEFEEKLKIERQEKSLDLHILTEVRGFGDIDEGLKQLSDTIDYKDRIKIGKRLSNCNGNSTKDFKSLSVIDNNISEEIRHKIENGDLVKIVLLITDGGSQDIRKAKKEKDALKKAGVIVIAIQIGKVSEEDKEKFKEVWQKTEKDGLLCQNVSNLVPTISKLLEKLLNNL